MRYLVLLVFSLCSLLQVQAQKKEKVKYVRIITDSGDIKIKLYNETPAHRDNFLSLVKQKYYDELLFHFIKQHSIIEGGDPNSYNCTDSTVLGEGNPGYTLGSEIIEGKCMKRGALVASRRGDKVNPNRESNGSQFFIIQGRKFSMQELSLIERQKKDTFTDEQKAIYMNEGGVPAWDGMYTIFGEIVEGFDVLDKLMAIPTKSNGRPVVDIKIWMRIVKR